MDRATPGHSTSSSLKHRSVRFLVSLMVLCARHAKRLSKKLKQKKQTHNGGGERYTWNLASSPARTSRPKELLVALRNKTMTMVRRRNTAAEEEEHGVWQREILMGDKCEPLAFSGMIYYDCNGRQLNEAPPRSPRASPLTKYPTIH